MKREITQEEAERIGSELGIDFKQVDLGEFCMGLAVELEHGAHDPITNVTDDNLLLTGKIAWAHLKEFPDYYTRLDKLEAEADEFWTAQRKYAVKELTPMTNKTSRTKSKRLPQSWRSTCGA